MELRHIRYFLALTEELNFTRAAARVGIGQPPFSQQIRALEDEVGAPLFRRLPQGAELTEAGRAFAEVVTDLPALTERAVRAAQRAARGETGKLRVGFTGSATFNPLVAGAIRAFRADWPDVDLTLEEANSARLLSALQDGGVDAVFLRVSAAPIERVNLRLVADEDMVVALPVDHPAARAPDVALHDLRGEALVLTPREVGPMLFDTVIAACRDAGFEPRLGQSAPQMGSIINLVAAGLGIALVPKSMEALQVGGVAYRPVRGRVPQSRLSLASRRGEASRVVRAFLNEVDRCLPPE